MPLCEIGGTPGETSDEILDAEVGAIADGGRPPVQERLEGLADQVGATKAPFARLAIEALVQGIWQPN
jgi:hypothetical protein